MSTALTPRPDRNPMQRRAAREHALYLDYKGLVRDIEAALAAERWQEAQALFFAVPDQILAHPEGRGVFVRSFSTGRRHEAALLWDSTCCGPAALLHAA